MGCMFCYNKLLQLQDVDTSRKQFVQNEADWFMKIAWNLALQCEDEPQQMKELYTLCSQLLSLHIQDDSCLSQQMTCLLMSAAACLQVARGSAEEDRRKDKTETACIALEHLSNNSPDTDQVLTALRCLIRLKLTVADSSSQSRNEAFEIISCIRTGYNKLLELQDVDTSRKQFVQNEADWFMKIAWNLALQCEDEPQQMKELYTLCSQLLSLNIQDDSCLSQQMTCLLMSAAACLQVARGSAEEDRRCEFWVVSRKPSLRVVKYKHEVRALQSTLNK